MTPEHATTAREMIYDALGDIAATRIVTLRPDPTSQCVHLSPECAEASMSKLGRCENKLKAVIKLINSYEEPRE